MSVGRRLLILLVVATAVAVPAIVLRALCVGRACAQPGGEPAATPFCSLPERVRSGLVNGFSEGRGPDVFAVTGDGAVAGSTGLEREALRAPWPSIAANDADRVPLALFGPGIRGPDRVPDGTTLDAVAPTIAGIIGFQRPTFQERIRSGRRIPGFGAAAPPRLVVLVVWKGVGSSDLASRPDKTPGLQAAIRSKLGGAGTLDGRVGSLPLDPAATLTTIGSGGLPRDHGITGTLIRNDEGRLLRAWSAGSPPSIIATLGDDLDELTEQRSLIGLVGIDVSDRGVIGGTWYEALGPAHHDRDDVLLGSGKGPVQAGLVSRLLGEGYGQDDVPDLLAVVMRDHLRPMDTALATIVQYLQERVPGRFLVVVTATGSVAEESAVPVTSIERDVEEDMETDERLVEATAVGGLFLDQRTIARTGIGSDVAVDALRRVDAPIGDPLFADAFPGTSITFARYC